MARKYDLDWTGVDLETAKLMLKQAELHLDAQLRVSLAADQRAMVTGGALTALSVGVVTATIAIAALSRAPQVLWVGLPTASTLIAAAFWAMRAARPVLFHIVGTPPIQWWDFRRDDPIALVGGETENYQERIEENEATLRKNAQRLNQALVIGLVAPVIGVVVWATLSIIDWI